MSTGSERDLKFETAGVLGTGLVGALFMTTSVERIGEEHYQRFRLAGQPVISSSGTVSCFRWSTTTATRGLSSW